MWAALRGTKFTGNSFGRLECREPPGNCRVELNPHSESGSAILGVNLHRITGSIFATLNFECPEYPYDGNPSGLHGHVLARAFSPEWIGSVHELCIEENAPSET